MEMFETVFLNVDETLRNSVFKVFSHNAFSFSLPSSLSEFPVEVK